MDAKHTLGPMTYQYEEMGGYDCMTGAYVIKSKNGETVATIDLGDYGQDSCGTVSPVILQRAENHARLIASAPELLEALKEMACRYEKLEGYYSKVSGTIYDCENGTLGRAKKLIAKAEGRA